LELKATVLLDRETILKDHLVSLTDIIAHYIVKLISTALQKMII